MKKAILIDSAAREVRAVEIPDNHITERLRELIGGWICHAATLPNGDTLYVDDEGLLKASTTFFQFKGRDDQPLAGNGVLVGRERINPRTGDYLGMTDVRSTVEQVTKLVTFQSLGDAKAWGRAHAHEAATAITTVEKDGTTKREVLSTFGDLFGNLPEPEEAP